MNKRFIRLLVAAMLAVVLVGCGGGGDGDPSNSTGGDSSDTNNNSNNNNANDDANDGTNDGTDDGGDPPIVVAEGLYRGTTSDGRGMTALLLDDSTYWILYTAAGLPNVGGGLQGTSGVDGTTFTSSQGRDFNLGAGMRDASIVGDYLAQERFSGLVTFADGSSFTFEIPYDATYEDTPSLALVSGSHSGVAYTVDGSLPASVVIGEDGSLTGTRGGCSISGTVTPRAHGNVYDLTLSFSGGACIVAGAAVEGVALMDSASGLLNASALNEERTVGFIFTESH